MTWASDIDAAMTRGKSKYTCLDVLSWIRSGTASFAATDDMSASVWWNGPDGAEVGHVAGCWSNEQAQWLLNWADRECAARGVDVIQVRGRQSWQRFLSIKGIGR